MPRIDWTKPQQLLALRLYCQLPFGQRHQRNPEIIAVASAINRTPSTVAMKAYNFASLDRLFQQTQKLFGIEGRSLILPNRFRPDEAALAYHRDEVFQHD